ncbi:sigma-70 family RNA polymerase sigma factor [Blautia sp.]|uniref:sigma-70 family RNA polymerase sigma factor n=1 Tax=Blautia sp. TaxID=1955243 RepID=UPI00257F40B5|nr:sigma-70 family RNA polymerase sigma factor [Blautia sp.]
MKDSYEQRIQNQFGAFCVKVLKNEARYIQREYTRLRDQEKSLGELTAFELEQTAVWDKHFLDEHVFDVQGLPVVVTGNLLADALAQLPEGKRDVILLSYFLGMFSLSESYSVCST